MRAALPGRRELWLCSGETRNGSSAKGANNAKAQSGGDEGTRNSDTVKGERLRVGAGAGLMGAGTCGRKFAVRRGNGNAVVGMDHAGELDPCGV